MTGKYYGELERELQKAQRRIIELQDRLAKAEAGYDVGYAVAYEAGYEEGRDNQGE